jgi:NCAIR mutase (PurE)-related protein
MADSELGHSVVDLEREQRQGFAEVIYAEHKLPEQVAEIAQRLAVAGQNVLATRATPAHYEAVKQLLPKAGYDSLGRIIHYQQRSTEHDTWGKIAVVCAGTSDLPVAQEAAFTAEFLGNEVLRINDVGVAGLHRLLARIDEIRACRVVIVVAGMEGALPSVVAGLVDKPLIAVPTSVGYGAAFEGVAALLGMLNSCGSGVSVVNIDNGFGAGYQASLVNRI